MPPVVHDALLPNADLIASMLDESPLAIDVKDRDGRYVRVSPVCATQLGLRRPDEAIGCTAGDFLSAEGAHAAQVDEQAVMRTGRAIVDVERREVHADGRVSWSLIARQPLRDTGGEIVGTIGVARDITHRKLADEALLSSNARLKRVIATQRELAASALDLAAVTQVVSERARELTGADGATVHLVDGADLLMRARSGAPVGLPVRRAIEDGIEVHALRHGRPLLLRDVTKDLRMRGFDHGSARSLVCAPFFHGAAAAGTLEVFVTGTDRVLDEHDRNTVALLAQMLSTALSQAAEFTAKRTQVETLARFETTFQGAPIGIAMVTADGMIVACNPAFVSLVGHTADELSTLTLGEHLIEDLDPERFDELMSGACDRFRVERRFRRSDGELVWGDASFALVRDTAGDPTFAIAMVQDVSARKQAEQERDRMELELRLAQKLESIGQLAAGIAHEINTPIQFVGDTIHFLGEAFGDLMELESVHERLRSASEGTVDPALRAEVVEALELADIEYLRERVPAAIERGLGGIQRVSTIVAAMRAFAHPPGASYAPTDLNEALQNTLVVARGEYATFADIAVDLGDLPPVTCDAGEINQVLLNLVVNAAHAIEDVVAGGERGSIRVRTRAEPEHVVITIADTGGGIPDDVADRIFDPFFTTKDVGRGTGQGLAISRTIVSERHGGELTFETEPGVGTAFDVRLPIAPPVAPA